MKRTLCAWLLALGLAVGTALPASAAPFSDVASDAWYAQAVGEVSDAGIMNGTTDTTFSPDEQVTRGMVVTVLWRLASSPAAAAATTFPDVEDWYYYAPAVAWAQAAGVATGLGDGTFDGGSIVTREQLSVFLYRYSQYAGDELASGVLDLYNDVDSVQGWALDGMAHAVGAGLITGTDEGNLEPAGPATRAQLAVILQRLMIPAVG